MPLHASFPRAWQVLPCTASVLLLTACTTPAFSQEPLTRPVFTGSYGSSVAEHTRFGREVGARFAKDIAKTLEESKRDGTLSIISPYMQTPEGRSNFSIMLATHNETFPNYVAEIAGTAEGAGVVFDDLFALNVGESLSTIADPYRTIRGSEEHCSDYSLWPYNVHNEDGGLSDENTSYWIDVEIDGARFMSFTYCGQLPSGAFGWNSHAVAFTLNWLGPYATDVHGMGRNFISRDLLRATNFADAITRVTSAHPHATGHNFQILSFREKEMANVEAAPHGLYKITPFAKGTPASFHANSYIHMTLPQSVSQSSKHRLARAAALPVPTNPTDMLNVLGDQADPHYPIFHDYASLARGDNSGSITLTSVLYDMDNGTITQYRGNPSLLRVVQTWTLL